MLHNVLHNAPAALGKESLLLFVIDSKNEGTAKIAKAVQHAAAVAK